MSAPDDRHGLRSGAARADSVQDPSGDYPWHLAVADLFSQADRSRMRLRTNAMPRRCWKAKKPNSLSRPDLKPVPMYQPFPFAAYLKQMIEAGSETASDVDEPAELEF